MADTLIRQGGATRFTQAVAALAASAGDRVRLAELTPPGQINLRGRPSDPRFVRTVGAVLGCVLPLNANTVTSAAEVTVLWLGPDEWLLVTNPGRRNRPDRPPPRSARRHPRRRHRRDRQPHPPAAVRPRRPRNAR